MATSKPKSPKSKKSAKQNASFGEQYAELEQIIDQVQNEDTKLEDVLVQFERGAELLELLNKQLDAMETKVDRIQRRFDVGE